MPYKTYDGEAVEDIQSMQVILDKKSLMIWFQIAMDENIVRGDVVSDNVQTFYCLLYEMQKATYQCIHTVII